MQSVLDCVNIIYMAEVLTIPKKLAQKGDLVIVSRAEYEQAINTQKRLLSEEQDTDEAIRVFESERKNGKLKRAKRFSDILG